MKLAKKRLINFKPENTIRRFGRSDRETLNNQLNVLVWNIFKAKRIECSEDFTTLFQNQDLVLLQEAVCNGHHDQVFENSEQHEWIMARSYRNQQSGLETGVKTGANSTAIEYSGLFSPDLEPVSGTPKLALCTLYLCGAERAALMVINIHAINFVSLAKYRNQLAQLRHRIVSHNGPLIVAGDFNTWNGPRYSHYQQFIRDCELQEAEIDRQARIQHLNRHLDHVCFRGLTLNSIQSLNTIKSSDHYPIQVSFSLPD